jgi:hypothetical protein
VQISLAMNSRTRAVLGQISSLFRWGWEGGHCEHVGALVSVIYDASTRAIVAYSMG